MRSSFAPFEFATACLCTLALGALGAVAWASPTEVRVDGGTVRGVVAQNVVSFKGIPYAAAPVGPLRWRAPQPVPGWRGTRAADHFGPDCMQVPFPGDAAPLGVTPAEDCLYLNVWSPAGGAARLPVMVWIYGGGFVNGGSSPPEYDGSAFARDGVVLVSFNYRLGNFGFFAHPALSAEQHGQLLGNYAFMDQLAALRWVQRNIARFGGDPHNVTVFGESAGGMSVNMLLTTPLAQGLFNKAIIESGGGGAGLLADRPLSGGEHSAEAMGIALAKRYGITGQGAEALSALRAIPAQQLLSGLNMATMGRDPTYVGGPILDGQLYRGTPTRLYAAGQGWRVPVIIGANSLDIGFVHASTLEQLFAQFGADASRARTLYDPKGDADLRTVSQLVGGDQMMLGPAREIAQLLARRRLKVYEYRFSYVAESLRATLRGAPHATEIPYVFDTVAARYGAALTANDARAARIVHAYWVAFARTGAPAPSGLSPWGPYDPQFDELLNFTAQGAVFEPDPWRARLELASRLSAREAQRAAAADPSGSVAGTAAGAASPAAVGASRAAEGSR